MTTGGSSYPSTPPSGHPGGQPTSPAPSFQGEQAPGQQAGAQYPPVDTPPPVTGSDRPRRRWVPLVLALVIGLVVGAGIVGVAWWTNRSEPGAAPPPIAIGLDTAPRTVLGQERDDLAMAKLDSPSAKDGAARRAKLMTEQIPAYQEAYGGPGIEATYGTVKGDTSYQLLLINGIQPAPLVASDFELESLRAITNASGVAAPGTETTQCVANPVAQGVVIKDGTTVAQARQAVLDDPQAMVTCVRSDRARNFSIQLRNWAIDSDDGPPASDRATTMAAEVDRIWASVVG